ncbi:3-hydroxybutyryl-CoA dehydrogenase [Psychrobacter glaciei]|uniref:3-hydroxybutyryl-CoA dehydrogenase n=1 Tax=Psychrobacter glaciei TaxID=619771 RepID=A0ABQ3GQM4_9GAMM|nr:3-hydroxyacyl-CoA dehydrogenase [Psychrobacter glaciei]GHD29180.1 3-hydroxybutyryl-CoA dehydrogenase [Psychrobacter glaciei]
MTYKNVTVAGSGILGYQIAFQAAFHGFNVSVYDINDEVLEKAKSKFPLMSKAFRKDLGATQEQLDKTFENLSYTSDLAEAVKDADLMIEAIPEIPKIKIEFYEKLAKLAPEKTIFATNTSTLLPSQFAASTGRPAQFLALHFANKIWMHNVAEIMGHPGTDPKVFDDVVAFATAIGMVALPLDKEQPGYIMNSLLAPFIDAGLQLLAKEVADPHTIDKTWMIVTGAPVGPFGILDTIGINTAYNITKLAAETTQNPVRFKAAKYLKD